VSSPSLTHAVLVRTTGVSLRHLHAAPNPRPAEPALTAPFQQAERLALDLG
jgi:hypothetical protein